jgi:hypothetical protein
MFVSHTILSTRANNTTCYAAQDLPLASIMHFFYKSYNDWCMCQVSVLLKHHSNNRIIAADRLLQRIMNRCVL